MSVTQAFDTTTSTRRLTRNVLLSFVQAERAVTGARIRDKIAAGQRKGLWMGGGVPLADRIEARALLGVPEQARGRAHDLRPLPRARLRQRRAGRGATQRRPASRGDGTGHLMRAAEIGRPHGRIVCAAAAAGPWKRMRPFSST